MRIAIIGSGIAGLSAAYYLSRLHTVFLFEKEPRLGGHTHTVTVESSKGPLPVDTGFIVHNDRNYPNLVKLFAELGVERQRSDMSFAVASPSTGFEYSSRGLNGFFAQRANLLRAHQYRLLAEILRFNREAPKLLQDPEAERMTLGDAIELGGYSPMFTERYLYPMASAVWSMSTEAIREFPVVTLVRFFDQHGMLGIDTHPQWMTLRGGCSSYLGPITGPYRDRICTGAAIDAVVRSEAGVRLRIRERGEMAFDQVVFACHGDEILPLLEAPTDKERDILGDFATSRNDVCLHSDSSLLPKRERARASWNYSLNADPSAGATLTYHMNRLQTLQVKEDYCVSLNAAAIRPDTVVRRLVYHHPLYNRRAVAAQARWSEISGHNRTHFCGAYWFYGFHEDGLNSGLRVARALGVHE